MENKTAMQRMLEWTRKTFPMDLDTPRMIEDKIESLLKVEKEQIRDAYNNGHTDGINTKEGLVSGTIYYNETYGKI